jgi:hypothetical protein
MGSASLCEPDVGVEEMTVRRRSFGTFSRMAKAARCALRSSAVGAAARVEEERDVEIQTLVARA